MSAIFVGSVLAAAREAGAAWLLTSSKGPDVSAEVMLMSEETVVDCVVDYAGIQGQGFFAIFSGYLGTESAGWCGKNFAKVSTVTQFWSTLLINLHDWDSIWPKLF